jgi:hypothetical protein
MAIDETRVDLLTLDDYRRQLQHRLDDARAILAAARRTRTGAELGAFQDARQTADRYATVHDEFVARIDRLVRALAAAADGTGTTLAAYRDTEQHSDADVQSSGS